MIWLKKILTPVGADALHKLRTLGNKAAHEVEPHSIEQLNIAINVVEDLLRHVYILPKQVQLAFEDN